MKTLTKEQKALVLLDIEKHGISPYNIVCVLRFGSSLYVKHPDDYDFKVFLKKKTADSQSIIDSSLIFGKVQYILITPHEWNDMLNLRGQCCIAGVDDMEVIYGDASSIRKYNVIEDKDVQKYVLNIYDYFFFNCTEPDYYLGEKRLWNFLVFYYKMKNHSNKLTRHQLKMVSKAHDLKFDKEKFRPLFEKLKEEIL